MSSSFKAPYSRPKTGRRRCRLCISFRSVQLDRTLLNHKTTVRTQYDLGWQRAEAVGGFDTIFVNAQGRITEGGAALCSSNSTGNGGHLLSATAYCQAFCVHKCCKTHNGMCASVQLASRNFECRTNHAGQFITWFDASLSPSMLRVRTDRRARY